MKFQVMVALGLALSVCSPQNSLASIPSPSTDAVAASVPIETLPRQVQAKIIYERLTSGFVLPRELYDYMVGRHVGFIRDTIDQLGIESVERIVDLTILLTSTRQALKNTQLRLFRGLCLLTPSKHMLVQDLFGRMSNHSRCRLPVEIGKSSTAFNQLPDAVWISKLEILCSTAGLRLATPIPSATPSPTLSVRPEVTLPKTSTLTEFRTGFRRPRPQTDLHKNEATELTQALEVPRTSLISHHPTTTTQTRAIRPAVTAPRPDITLGPRKAVARLVARAETELLNPDFGNESESDYEKNDSSSDSEPDSDPVLPQEPAPKRVRVAGTFPEPVKIKEPSSLTVIHHPVFEKHFSAAYERSTRVTSIKRALKKAFSREEIDWVEATPITRSQLERVHNSEYLTQLERISDTIDEKNPRIPLDQDGLKMNKYTLEAAWHAAGSAVQAVDLVSSGKTRNVFSNVRPPGHHASRVRSLTECPESLGFCIFNNVAAGAQYALDSGKYKNVVVVDFDVHHGDGTEEILAGNPQIHFFSLYQEEEGFFASPEPACASSAVAAGAGASPVVHRVGLQPVSDSKSSFAQRRSNFQKLESWADQIRAIQPDLLFFSAGFDAHESDPLGGLKFTDLDYYNLTRMIVEAANCPVISILEGGYNPSTLGDTAVAHIQGILDLQKAHTSLTTTSTAKAACSPEIHTVDDTSDSEGTAAAAAGSASSVKDAALKAAADTGDGTAQYDYAYFLESVEGGNNLVEARKYYATAAAKLGLYLAQFNYAYFLEKGLGGPRQPSEAMQFYYLSALGGYAPAQFNYAVMIENGKGKDSLKIARHFYQLSADQGFEPAKKELVQMLIHGKGGPKNLKLARKYR